MTIPSQNALELPMPERALAALKAAVRKTLVERAREGRKVYVGRNGEVVEISAAELLAELDSSSSD
jgi:hypothetical protein